IAFERWMTSTPAGSMPSRSRTLKLDIKTYAGTALPGLCMRHRDTKAQRHKENAANKEFECVVFFVPLCLCVSVFVHQFHYTVLTNLRILSSADSILAREFANESRR